MFLQLNVSQEITVNVRHIFPESRLIFQNVVFNRSLNPQPNDFDCSKLSKCYKTEWLKYYSDMCHFQAVVTLKNVSTICRPFFHNVTSKNWLQGLALFLGVLLNIPPPLCWYYLWTKTTTTPSTVSQYISSCYSLTIALP